MALLADRFLIGDAVKTALIGRGFAIVNIPMPGDAAEVRRAERTLRRFQPSVGLLLSEVDEAARLQRAMEIVHTLPGRWLVLTSSTMEATWGAVIDAGAVAVLPMSVSLEVLSGALASVVSDRPVMAEEARSRALRAWQAVSAEQARLVEQMQALTPRELAVLGLLYEGISVKTIAEEAGVSEGTVRSQVKSVLRKLQVNSQLAAVAAYRQVIEQRG